jgi:integrase
MPQKLTKATVTALKPKERPYIVYDEDIVGLGVRVAASGAKSWTLEYRTAASGRRAPVRRVTIGKVDALTPDAARRRANELRGLVAFGRDPAQERADQRTSGTITELAEQYLREEIEPKKKPRTAELYEAYFRVHVVPAIGARRARDVTRADIARLHRVIGKDAEATANRVLVLLSGLYRWAGLAGEVPEGLNPAKGITKFRESGRERFLSSDELARLGDTLIEAETDGLPWEVDDGKPTAKHTPKQNQRMVYAPHIVAAFRMLLFTGCRLREILHLRWDEIDLERGFLTLPDHRSKTGKRVVHLSAPALAVLESLQRLGPYVIPGAKVDQPRHDLHKPWDAIKRRADLPGVRLHDLRHTFASIGAAGGLGLLAVGKLLGHKQTSTTAKYAHLDSDPLRRANEAIGAALAGALSGRNGANVVPIRKSRRR